MKILFLTESLSTKMGGLATGTLHLAIGLAKHFNLDQHQIITQEDNENISFDDEYDLPKNLSIIKVPKLGPKIYPISLSMREKIKSFNADVLYLKGLWRQTSLEAYLWKKKNPNKILILCPAGMLQPTPLQNKKILKLISIFFIEKKLFSKCDILHTVSLLEKKSILESRYNFKKIIFIPEGLPKNKLKITRKTKFSKELVSISRIAPIKGLEILLEACKKIDFNGWKILIYGNGSEEYINKLQKIISQNKLDENVELKEAVFNEDKYKVLSEASAFILPSYSESFGIAIAEAMFFGLPIITTTKTPWSSIKSQNLGWFVNPEKEALVSALQNLFKSSEYNLDRIGNRAKSYISKKYDLMSTSKQMKEEIISSIKLENDF